MKNIVEWGSNAAIVTSQLQLLEDLRQGESPATKRLPNSLTSLDQTNGNANVCWLMLEAGTANMSMDMLSRMLQELSIRRIPELFHDPYVAVVAPNRGSPLSWSLGILQGAWKAGATAGPACPKRRPGLERRFQIAELRRRYFCRGSSSLEESAR
ncbi:MULTISPECIES: hypothetical protein [unclassified Bradyrhizobium]|uniref:hypothetical protein n=1 Tax=unclassified Bradyrhizobium TaxID=2631580 RepID=UPI001161341B|nr:MULTISPECIES: hypothetical protein [unclassified Bradyrhizobium]